MHKGVIVTALKPFDYQGRSFTPGRHVEMTAVDAVQHERLGLVSLSRVIDPVLNDPDPEPAPSRRRYRRRDLVSSE